ncbi:MAG: hypothetical protein L0J74_04095 [Corynebacterium sp.]|uniref:hypothetical protein n=1 Tax=Corynebacterium TaxID=1716 RepID=UPI0026482F10|nr:hypothetical protein [Corynebacterium sp.]MDN5722984.1 hypothetical protein [Corynebacterium sp.]MDN6281403.1 hypothetical protein [Corynebacterium sp.]MDN6304976.1 hypothetical protein [Corynebacterium sp.]MDN6354011.1 hypothetical protein [Corynebacterium sp.]MDN6367126.1 hypothetical protein [Corynebacterium sp.]
MFGTAITALIFGTISGAGAWWASDQDRWGWATILGVVTLVLAIVAISTAFAGAVAAVFRLLPLLLIILVGWLAYKQFQKNKAESNS